MSQSQQQIKRLLAKEVSNLNAQCVASLSIGFLGIVFVPFLYPKLDDSSDIVINLMAISGGLGLGAYCLSKCSHLDESAGKLKGLGKLENNLLKREWALQHQQELNYLASAQQTPIINVSSTEVPRAVPQEVPGTVTAEHTETALVTESELEANEEPELELTAIKQAILAGIPESSIIKEIMGYRGRRYQEGKELFESIKAIILKESCYNYGYKDQILS